MTNGLEECRLFIRDAIAQGLGGSASTRTWDQMAARMIDAKAPGVARRLKRISSRIGVGADWEMRVAADLGSLELLYQAARGIADFDEPLQAEIRSELGLTVRKEDLDPVAAVHDTWDVLGQAVEVEDRLTVYRSWLKGRLTHRWALHLAFAAPGQVMDDRLVAGTAFSAGALFYPSASPLRAHFIDRIADEFAGDIGESWADSAKRLSEALSATPWIELQPVQISEASLGRRDGLWYLIDREGESFPVRGLETDLLAILSRTGNMPCEMCGEWDGASVRLLSAWGHWGYLSL